MQEDLVSVIIPAYNHERYIEEAIMSVINQTYRKIELIVVNDGSKDNTWQKICTMKDACEQRFLNTLFIEQENKGVIFTLNKAVSLAKGEYLFMMASDDFVMPEAIEEEYDFLSKNKDYVLVVGDSALVDENSERIFFDEEKRIFHKDGKYATFGEYLQSARRDVDFMSEDFGSYESLLRSNYIPNGFLIRRQDFIDVGGYKEGLLEDWYLNLRLSRKGKYKFINKIFFNYRWHSTNTIKQTEKMLKITEKTKQHELNLAYASGDKNWIRRIKEASRRTDMICEKTVVNMPSVLRISKMTFPFFKKMAIKIFGKEFSFIYKRRKEKNL